MIKLHSDIPKRTPFYDRREAGELLAEKLFDYRRKKDVLVIAIPRGGVPVGAAIAEKLQVPLLIFPCYKMVHPANPHHTIGSVGPDEVIMHADPEIPMDVIQHQFRRLKSEIQKSQECYGTEMPTLDDKTIILVDDRLKSEDTILACIRSIRKKNAARIILAIPIIRVKEKSEMEKRGIRVVSNISAHQIKPTEKYFEKFSHLNDSQIKRIIEKSDIPPFC